MNDNRDERGYSVPGSGPSVSRSHRGTEVEVDMEPDGMWIRMEHGSGYMRETCSGFVHMDQVVRMMEAVGYTVTRDPT